MYIVIDLSKVILRSNTMLHHPQQINGIFASLY